MTGIALIDDQQAFSRELMFLLLKKIQKQGGNHHRDKSQECCLEFYGQTRKARRDIDPTLLGGKVARKSRHSGCKSDNGAKKTEEREKRN